MKKVILLFSMFFLVFVPTSVHATNNLTKNKKIYDVDLTHWNIHNDDTDPVDTTEGINKVLMWAKQNGYNEVDLPAGTYLISKGKSSNDSNSRINMVSNMTLKLDKNASLQKETNGYTGYQIVEFGRNINNATLEGGTVSGDRTSHNYSAPGTHEFGSCVSTSGAQNSSVVGVTVKNCTGDGIYIGGSTVYGYKITGADLEQGGINSKGQPIKETGKVRSNKVAIKKQNFNNKIYNNPLYRNVMMWLPKGVNGYYNIYFYDKHGKFITEDINQHFNSTWGFSQIPKDAASYKVVFNATSPKNISVQAMTVAVTHNFTIKNSIIDNNRRNGITVGASDSITILNNTIQNTHGTAPQAGIDIEPGYFPALNTAIKGNTFKNNVIQTVLAYGGKATIEDNVYDKNVKNGLGLHISPSYWGATVENNTFNHSGFTTWVNTKFLNNKLTNSNAEFLGDGITVNGIKAIDSGIVVNSDKSKGITVSNITMTSTGLNTNTGRGINVFGDPTTFENLKLEGSNGIYGTPSDGNIYDHVTVTNPTEMNWAPGTYQNCTFNKGNLELGTAGEISFKKCQFNDTTMYEYNEKTSATIDHSTFNYNKPLKGHAIVVLQAKNIKIQYNVFNDKHTTNANAPLIQIGRDAWKGHPTNVFNATIKDNKLISNSKRIGIDTSNGGVGAVAYTIENNVLTNNALILMKKDIYKNNVRH